MLDKANPLANARRAQRARTIGSVLRSTASIAVGCTAFFLILDALGISLAPFIASVGIVGVALGFGAQSLVKDFLTGLFMLLEDQYGVGDVIDVGPANGTVEAVTLRITKIRDADGTLWYVPNGTMLRVGNKTQGWATAVVEIDVDYFADLDQVRSLLSEAAARVAADPVTGSHILGEPTITGIEKLSADAVTLRLKVKTSPAQQWEVARELRIAARRALEQAHVPLAGQRDLMATHRAAVAERTRARDPHDTPLDDMVDRARRTRGVLVRRRRSEAQAQSSRGSPAWTVSPSGDQDGEQVGVGLQGDDRADGRQVGGVHVERRPGDQVVAGAHGLPAVDVQREPRTGQADGVDPEVDQDRAPLAQLERERVRVQRADHAVGGRDDRLRLRCAAARSRGRDRRCPRANTGSGTAVTGRTTPVSGLTSRRVAIVGTARPASAQGVELGGEVVGLRADDHLDDATRAHDTERSAGLEGALVDEVGVGHLDAQPGDARLEVHDVRVPTQRCEDLLCLAHGTPQLAGACWYGATPRVTLRGPSTMRARRRVPAGVRETPRAHTAIGRRGGHAGECRAR